MATIFMARVGESSSSVVFDTSTQEEERTRGLTARVTTSSERVFELAVGWRWERC